MLLTGPNLSAQEHERQVSHCRVLSKLSVFITGPSDDRHIPTNLCHVGLRTFPGCTSECASNRQFCGSRMSSSTCSCLLAIAVLLVNVSPAAAQEQHRNFAVPKQSYNSAQEQRRDQTRYVADLRKITRAAGTIFAGIVTSVRHTPASKLSEIETVQVSFRVDHAIRGTRAGENLTIHEWAGLWSTGDRYRVGEHVLLFLYPPSKLGLTSPVGGPLGRFNVDQADLVVLKTETPKLPPNNAGAEKPPGKSRVSYREFSRAIHRAAEE